MATPEPLPKTEPTPSLSISGVQVTDPVPEEDKETPKKQGTTAPPISSILIKKTTW